MEITFIKVILLVTTGKEIFSFGQKIPWLTRDDCRCGEWGNSSIKRIAGGMPTIVNIYPWQALIRRHIRTRPHTYPENYVTCGGTIINDAYILTAAECAAHGIVKYRENQFNIVLGLYDTSLINSSKNQFYKVVEIIIPDTYEPRYSSDIALLKLNKRIAFNELVKPICLPNQYEQIEGKTVMIIGWGPTISKGEPSRFLQETSVTVLSRTECRLFLFDNTMFCASGSLGDLRHIRGSCQGDSGGPMFYTTLSGILVQIGIIASPHMCGVYPSLYTRVSTFTDWILENTRHGIYCRG